MKVYVPVNKAVQRGRLTVNLLGAIIFLIVLLGIPSIVLQYTETTWIMITACVIGFALGFLLGWIYSGFAVVRWKIWAYENVQNLHELKQKAIVEKVIYPDGHWSEKLNFASYEQRQKLKQLEKRFSEEDKYHDDLEVSKETAIFISKRNILFMTVIGVVILGVAIYRYFHHAESNALMLALLSLLFFGLAFNDYRKKEPQILISNNGIKLYKKELMLWEYITNEHIEIIRGHENHKKYFVLDYKGKEVKFLINSIEISIDEFEHLLRVYRLRFNKNENG